jgi:hypothetical protein
VTLEPLHTPANVRFEATISGAKVILDGDVLGDAPIEVALAPGKHSVEVRAESYLEQTVPFEVGPGERTIVRVALSKRRAPLGVRIAPYFVTTIPLRGDTPFGTWKAGAGIHLFHQALTYRAFRFGLAGEYAGKAKVTKVDVDANQRTAARFNVRSIPSILFFKNGKHVDTVVGAVPKATLEGKIKQHLA